MQNLLFSEGLICIGGDEGNIKMRITITHKTYYISYNRENYVNKSRQEKKPCHIHVADINIRAESFTLTWGTKFLYSGSRIAYMYMRTDS